MRKCLYALLLCLAPLFAAADIAPVTRTRIMSDMVNEYPLTVQAGETRDLEFEFYRNTAPIPLSNASPVLMTYELGTNVYAVQGAVQSATGGVVRVRWESTNGTPQGNYRYLVAVRDMPATNVVLAAARGTLTVKKAISGSPGTAPVWIVETAIGAAYALASNAYALAGSAYSIATNALATAQTAFGWGNHADAGYLAPDENGDVYLFGNMVLSGFSPEVQRAINWANGFGTWRMVQLDNVLAVEASPATPAASNDVFAVRSRFMEFGGEVRTNWPTSDQPETDPVYTEAAPAIVTNFYSTNLTMCADILLKSAAVRKVQFSKPDATMPMGFSWDNFNGGIADWYVNYGEGQDTAIPRYLFRLDCRGGGLFSIYDHDVSSGGYIVIMESETQANRTRFGKHEWSSPAEVSVEGTFTVKTDASTAPLTVSAGVIKLSNLPTDPTGLDSGTLWVDSNGFLKVAP
jgi:hypothetical protein